MKSFKKILFVALLSVATTASFALESKKSVRLKARPEKTVNVKSSTVAGCCKEWCTVEIGRDEDDNPMFLTFCCKQCPVE
jgi:hypothetical protein